MGIIQIKLVVVLEGGHILIKARLAGYPSGLAQCTPNKTGTNGMAKNWHRYGGEGVGKSELPSTNDNKHMEAFSLF